MLAGSTQSATPWYRQFWPWFIIGLPACAVVASVATLFIAAGGTDTLVVSDYNRIEELTAQNRARDASATALGLAATLSLDDDTNRVLVHLTAQTQPGVLWQPDRLRLALGHPTRKTSDQSVLLIRQGGNRYEGELTAIPADRRYLELLPEPEPEDVRPMWRLTAEWYPGRAEYELSAAPPR